MRVFLVEDNYDMQDLFEETFQKLGWTVVEMVDTTCDEAFQKATTSKADLFFLDIDVEYPTAGLDFAKRLHQYDKNVKIVYLTKADVLDKAYDNPSYPRPVDYIPKTRHKEDIIKLLRSFKRKYESDNSRSITLTNRKRYVVLEEDIALVKRQKNGELVFFLKDGTEIRDSEKGIRELVNEKSKNFISTLQVASLNKYLVNPKYVVEIKPVPRDDTRTGEDENGEDKIKAAHFVLSIQVDNKPLIHVTTSVRGAENFK
jgi:two-component SAPR family response regulator